MARVGLGLGVRDLAKLAEVSPNTVTRLEGGGDTNAATRQAIRRALEKRGAIFTNGDEPGVKLRKSAEAPTT